MENLLSVKQAAFVLKVHPLTIRRYLKDGKLKAVRAGGNIRIKETQLTEFNKDFEPLAPKPKSPFKLINEKFLTFSKDDPFLQLKGSGASLHLEKT